MSATALLAVELPDRIRTKIVLCGSGCWRWAGSVDKDGYGTVRERRADGLWTVRKAHRVVWEHAHGRKLEREEELDHTCNLRGCVHPLHGVPCSRRTNMQVIHARVYGGATISEAGMRAIYDALATGTPFQQVAEAHGMAKGELIALTRSTPYRRLLAKLPLAQGDLLAAPAPDPDDEYLPEWLR